MVTKKKTTKTTKSTKTTVPVKQTAAPVKKKKKVNKNFFYLITNQTDEIVYSGVVLNI